MVVLNERKVVTGAGDFSFAIFRRFFQAMTEIPLKIPTNLPTKFQKKIHNSKAS
jgi:hypothetical protein